MRTSVLRRVSSAATVLLLVALSLSAEARPRARELGIEPGILPTGPLNAITDVAGVRVGHATLIRGENVRTGVTAVVPHEGNLFAEKVPAALHVTNGFGKFIGATQVQELGEIETPILLTSTLNVFRVADALVSYMLALPGNETVRSINPVVGETNDGRLNAGRLRASGADEVSAALRSAKGGAVEEGAVGAGTGTIAFGFKGGIGTSSRKLPASLGGWTVGVLVQSNFGGVLTIDGVPVGEELGRYYLKDELSRSDSADGSIMMIVATDAPLTSASLERLAARATFGLARTGAAGTNGSGDYAIAFSTHPDVRRSGDAAVVRAPALSNDALSPLFLAAAEATEEAVYNSLLKAITTTGNGITVEALPIDQLQKIFAKYKP